MRTRGLPAGIRILLGAEFLVALGYGLIAPVLPAYAAGFGVGVAAASAVVSAFAVFRLVFAPVNGPLIRLLGELWVFCAGLLVVGASSAACAFATNFGQLLAFRAVGGIGSTLFTVSAAALLIRFSPPTMRGRAAGLSATAWLAGSVAGPLVGGVLAEFGPRIPFLVYAALLGVVAAFAVATLPRPGPDPMQSTAVSLSLREALHQPIFRAALCSNLVNGWTVYGIRVALVPLYIVDGLGLSTWLAGMALTAFALGTAATSALGGGLADSYGRRPVVLVGLVVVGAAMGVFGLLTSPFMIITAALLSGAGTGLTSPPTNAAVADVLTGRGGSAGTGTALASFQMAGDCGAIVGPVVAGAVAEWAGYSASFALTAAITGGAFVSWLRAGEPVVRGRQILPSAALAAVHTIGGPAARDDAQGANVRKLRAGRSRR